MLLRMDCFGARWLPQKDAGTQQFLTADFNRSVHIHHTSLDVKNDSRVYGGSQGKLVMVADGLGTEDCGQRAATVAVDAVTQNLLNAFRTTDQTDIGNNLYESRLKAALEHCQRMMQREGSVIEAHSGMGAEVAVAYVAWPFLYLVQAGRTSCCLWRDGQVSFLNGSGAGEIVGGLSGQLYPSFVQRKLRMGDKLLLSSNSVTSALDEFQIASALTGNVSSVTLCDRLLSAVRSVDQQEHTVVVATFDQGVGASAPPDESRTLSGQAEASKTRPGLADHRSLNDRRDVSSVNSEEHSQQNPAKSALAQAVH